MKCRNFSLPVLSILVILMTGCAAPATPPPTPTPTPLPSSTPTNTPTTAPSLTPTATPIPYDLDMIVTDADGDPITDAGIDLSIAGAPQGESVITDAKGKASWRNLTSEQVSLSVKAQGYLPGQATQTLARGPNQVPVKLELDPHGLLPSNGCSPNETLLYIEDFQDDKAQGWQNITGAIDFNAQNGWSIAPLEEGNKVLTFSNILEGSDDLANQSFDDAVWRLKVRLTGNNGFSFLNWRHAPAQGGETRYPLQWGDGGVMMALTRLEMPGAGHFPVGQTQMTMGANRWYYLEISTYQGDTQVWVDGRKMIDYTDPKLMPPGTIGIEVHMFKGPQVSYYFDNLAICQLKAPFETLPQPKSK
jgi:hypothetical protein